MASVPPAPMRALGQRDRTAPLQPKRAMKPAQARAVATIMAATKGAEKERGVERLCKIGPVQKLPKR